jgi:hypothetical protein
MAWLGEELPEPEQDDRTPFAPRCTKDLVEERLFAHRRDLFSRLDLVFMDTTSLSFEGAGGQTLGRRGHSKDHRPDLCQMTLAVLIDGDGRRVCSEMWPGNIADARRRGRGWGPFPQPAGETLIPVIDRLRRRFAIGRICVVADRGLISTATVAALEERKLLYLLGTRERTDQVVRAVVLADSAPCVPLTIARRGHEIDYEAKAVTVGGRRYILGRNHQEAERDASNRAAILAKLAQQLKKGDKALIGNTGFRRFLTTEGRHFAIDPAKAEEDARFDGVFVLRTNTDLDPLAAMLRSKQLWTVEAAFRTAKHLLATRPIFHQRDATIRLAGGKGLGPLPPTSRASRVLLRPRPGAQGRARAAHHRARPRRLVVRDPRRPRLADRDRDRPRRQTLPRPRRPAPRRQPRISRRRRRPAADRPGSRRRLIPIGNL